MRLLVPVIGMLISVGCAAQRPVVPRLKYGAVATVHPIATDAAMRTLRSGGNAVDAAVAAMLTLGVVDNHNSGLGGGCFIIIRMKDGPVCAIDARETAPALASRDMYLVNGAADPALSQVGPHAVATPGALAGYELAIRKWGRKPLAELLLPAARIAEDGFPIDRPYAQKLARTAEQLAKYDGSASVLLKEDGSAYREGDVLRQPDLAHSYRAIARQGTEWFYRGEFAARVSAWMAANGGLLRTEDFAGYSPRLRPPLTSTYRGYTIIGMPPPSSGGLHVSQILTMLEPYDLGTMSDADRVTVMANAMSLAFADRAFWLGDPDFATVPRGLMDADYLRGRASLLRSDRAISVAGHGNPPAVEPPSFDLPDGKHTTHVSVIDAQGNAVAVTATVNTTFGSKVIVPGTGIVLNNEMDDFSAQPGVPNAFGLIGMEANAIAPGKRPLSSMSPAIVVNEDGDACYVLGAAGGPKIITQVVCVLSNLIDRKLSPRNAMEEPRFHHQWRKDELWVEKSAGAPLLGELKRRGFTLDESEPSGATNLVSIERNGDVIAVSETRLPGKSAAE